MEEEEVPAGTQLRFRDILSEKQLAEFKMRCAKMSVSQMIEFVLDTVVMTAL
jgi:hypothetical protein